MLSGITTKFWLAGFPGYYRSIFAYITQKHASCFEPSLSLSRDILVIKFPLRHFFHISPNAKVKKQTLNILKVSKSIIFHRSQSNWGLHEKKRLFSPGIHLSPGRTHNATGWVRTRLPGNNMNNDLPSGLWHVLIMSCRLDAKRHRPHATGRLSHLAFPLPTDGNSTWQVLQSTHLFNFHAFI